MQTICMPIYLGAIGSLQFFADVRQAHSNSVLPRSSTECDSSSGVINPPSPNAGAARSPDGLPNNFGEGEAS